MPRYLADQNFREDFIAGLLTRVPSVDIVRTRDIGLSAANDETVLERAAEMDRIVLTHDRRMTRYAYARVESGFSMPGLIVVPQVPANYSALLDILQVLTEFSLPGEWVSQVLWISDHPLSN